MRYWPDHGVNVLQTKPPLFYKVPTRALAVETAGYALLAQLTLGDLDYSGAIVTWLVAQRTNHGAFVSTQVRTQSCVLSENSSKELIF